MKISVIVPIYNVEKYVSKCIESIIKQSYKDLQIILVDDGSTDTSGLLCDQYAEKDQRIVVIHKPNGGLVTARKAGLAAASGAYIGFVDGDDYIDKDFYEHLMTEMQSEKVDVVISGFIHETEFGNVIFRQRYDKQRHEIEGKQIDFLKEYIVRDSQERVASALWARLFKADLIKDAYGEVPNELSKSEDYICDCVLYLKCKSICMLDRTKYHYVKRETSICNSNRTTGVNAAVHWFEYVKQLFEREGCYDQLQDAVTLHANQFYLTRVKNVWPDMVQEFVFDQIDIVKGKKVVIFGAGKVGNDYYTQICRYQECKIVAMVDNQFKAYHYDYVKVQHPDILKNIEFDYVIIAIRDEELAHQVKMQLRSLEVAHTKILWSYPQKPQFRRGL